MKIREEKDQGFRVSVDRLYDMLLKDGDYFDVRK